MTIPFEKPYSDVVFIDVPETSLVVVHHSGVTLGQLRDLFDSAGGPLQAEMSEGRFTPAGPFLAVYYGEVSGEFDLDIGFPATEVAASLGETLTRVTLPASPAAALTHFGSYDGLGDAWARLGAAVMSAGKSMTAVSIEVYVANPMDTPVESLRTDLIAVLA